MRALVKLITFLIVPLFCIGQGGTPVSNGDLPNYIPPTPEVASILKADFLGVSKNTGAANFSFPLVSLSAGSYSLPVSLNYNSTGIKVDETASMVGMGWSLSYGGVVSRVVMGIPDEYRVPNSNLDPQDFTVLDYDEIDYLDHLDTDKQSDIFSFSLPGLSGKFILDQNLIPKPLSQYNIRVNVIDSVYMNGFIITTDNGTKYYFEDEETSISRSLIGTNCKSADSEFLSEVKTSWYLSKIVLPSNQEEINFTYTTNTIRFSGSITQSFTLTTASELYTCEEGMGPSGAACSIGESRFTSCRKEQWVISKFVTKIEGTNGNKIEFFYDSQQRADLSGGLRLSSIKQTNLKGSVTKNIVFNGSYQNALNTSSGYTRLFLESINIRDGANSTDDQLTYSFTYDNYDALPKPNSFAQDIYGYYNGKNSNTSILPVLPSTDINYATFNNGIGFGGLYFGNRSIDSNYSAYGMLTSVHYPTGGRDTILYTPNYVVDSWLNEIPGGGVSVKKIISYTGVNTVALEKEYIYRKLSNNTTSSFLLFWHPTFSEVRTVAKDGYICTLPGPPGSYLHCVGPTCTKASVSSSSYYPVTSYGSQHLYHESVVELTKGSNGNNGLTEYKYQYYLGSGLLPQIVLGTEIKTAAPNIVPDILVGESEINMYKWNGLNYSLVKSTINEFENDNSTYYKNYFVRKNYESYCSYRPVGPVDASETNAYDISEGRIYLNTPKLTSVTERVYDDDGAYSQTVTDMEYDLELYSYPRVIKTVDSKGKQIKTERFYAPDNIPAMNFMINRNIVAPVLEEKIYYNNVLQKSSKTTYVDWFSNSNLIVPQYQETRDGSGNKTGRIDFKAYDTRGNVLTVGKENDLDVAYFWGYDQQFPVAKVMGKSHADALSQSGIDQGVLNSVSTTETNLRTELNKLRPLSNTFVTTYTYQPGIGTSTETDASGKTTYYEYDRFGRLALIRDNDRNIVRQVCYNYFGQTEDCTVDINPHWVSTGVTRCAPCPTNNNYTSNIQEHQERDGNPSSPGYDTYRWVSDGVNSNCVVTADWQNTVNLRCKLVNGHNNGEQEREQKDMNPCSPTYNQTRWVPAGTNLTACPLPVIYAKIFVTDIYNDFEQTTATILIKFFSNVDCTIPISVSNLSVNYKEVRTNCGGGGTTLTNNYYEICNGTQTSLGTQVISWDDGIHCWNYTFTVTAGTGYQLGN